MRRENADKESERGVRTVGVCLCVSEVGEILEWVFCLRLCEVMDYEWMGAGLGDEVSWQEFAVRFMCAGKSLVALISRAFSWMRRTCGV